MLDLNDGIIRFEEYENVLLFPSNLLLRYADNVEWKMMR